MADKIKNFTVFIFLKGLNGFVLLIFVFLADSNFLHYKWFIIYVDDYVLLDFFGKDEAFMLKIVKLIVVV